MNKISVKAILSDASGILIEDNKYGKGLMKAVAAMTGRNCEELWKAFAPYAHKARTVADYSNSDALRAFLSHTGLNYSSTESVLAGYQAHPCLSVLPDVHNTLRNLKEQGIQFIIITDATVTAEQMRPALSVARLSDMVTDVISSKDVGVTKPDRRIFDYALERNGLRKDDVVFVAHEHDELYGAHTLGYNVIAVNYDIADNLSFIPEERMLATFPDILKIVSLKSND
ncbi:HAD hydrolase-like protein [Candidatus Woesearchaeota archaeon]|nr:HAD hydrolase-like protein [Candidatus Woesearchaeota archaeon]